MKKFLNMFFIIILCCMAFLNKRFFLLILSIEKLNIKNYGAMALSVIIVLCAYCLVFFLMYSNNKARVRTRKLMTFIFAVLLSIGLLQCDLIAAFYKCSPTMTIFADPVNHDLCVAVDRKEIPEYVIASRVCGDYLEIQFCKDKNGWGTQASEFIKKNNLKKIYLKRKELRSYKYVIG